MIQVFTNNKYNDVHAYLIHNEKKQAILIDTGFDLSTEINSFIKNRNIKLTDIFITHAHFDHIMGINAIYNANNNPTVHIGKDEMLGLFNPTQNLSDAYDVCEKSFVAEPIKKMKVFKGGEKLEINGYKIEVILAGGHSKGMLMYNFTNLRCLFNGDSLFKDGLGGVDTVPGAESKKIEENVKLIIETFPKGYILFPGHHEFSFNLREFLSENPNFNKYDTNKND